MKKLIPAAIALLLCLTGCADRNSSAPAPTGTAGPASDTTAAQTTSDNTIPEEADVSLPALTEPLTALEGIELEGTSEEIVSRGPKAAVQCRQGSVQQYHIIDLKEAKILRTGTLTDGNERLAGLTESGEAVTLSIRSQDMNGVLRYYGEAETPRSYEAGWISRNGYDQLTDSVFGYDYEKNAVMRMDGTGTETVFLQLQPDRYLISVHPDRRVLMISEPSGDMLQPLNAAAYSLDSGIRLGAVPQYDSTSYAFSGRNLLQIKTVFDHQIGETSFELRTSRFMDDEILSGIKTEDKDQDQMLDLKTDFASPYAIGAEQSAGGISGLIFADLKAGTRAVQPFPDGETATAAQFVWSQENARWFCAASFAESGRTVTRLFAAEPRFVEQTETYSPVESLSPVPERHKPADYLEGARRLADSIEKKYGIRILIGDEVLDIEPYGAELTSVQAEEGQLTTDDISGGTVIALKKLDARLQVYPKDFFGGFRDEYGEGGLAVLLPKSIRLNDGVMAAGVTSQHGKWYTVSLETAGALHHELWHAVEARISSEDGNAFSGDGVAAWNALLPQGFAYSAGTGGPTNSSYARDTGEPEKAWFADPYGCTNELEDRATLIEWLFDGYSSYQRIGTERKLNWELLPLMPHIQAKIDFMAKRVKKAFGAVYWEQIMQAGYDNTVFENEDFSPYP